MKRRLILGTTLLITLLCVTFTVSDTSTAVPHYIEYFNDGLDGWTTRIGGFIIDNGRLTATHQEYNLITTHECTSVYGWWSFDVYHDMVDNHRGWSVFFVADGFHVSGYPLNSYELTYYRTGHGVPGSAPPHVYELAKRVDGLKQNPHDGYLDSHISNDLIETVHVDIVRRHDNGHLYVWLNYTGNDPETGIFFDTNETTHTTPLPTTCSYFAISMDHQYTQWIDNIYVDTNSSRGPPPGPGDIPDPDIVAIFLLVTPWAIGLTLVVGGFLVWRRRQKKVKITPGEELKDSK